MTFWIYNVGLGVPISDKQLMVKRKTIPLDELAKTARIHSTDDSEHEKPRKEKLYSSLKRTPDLASEYKKNNLVSHQQVFFAEQIMSSPVITLTANATFASAWQLYQERRFRHFPVMGNNGKLAGIVSERDMLIEAASREMREKPERERERITRIMNGHVLTASAKTNIREICRVMIDQHIGAIPITSDKGELKGIVTRSDILRALINNVPLELWI